MVPSRYPALAGLLAGVVTLRDRLIPFAYAWMDADVATLTAYHTATMWLAFLLVPVAALAVGYAGGRTVTGDSAADLGRVGLVCLAVGVVASLVAVAAGVLLRPDSVTATPGPLLRAVGYAYYVVRTPVLAAVAVVAGVAFGARRRAPRGAGA